MNCTFIYFSFDENKIILKNNLINLEEAFFLNDIIMKQFKVHFKSKILIFLMYHDLNKLENTQI